MLAVSRVLHEIDRGAVHHLCVSLLTLLKNMAFLDMGLILFGHKEVVGW